MKRGDCQREREKEFLGEKVQMAKLLTQELCSFFLNSLATVGVNYTIPSACPDISVIGLHDILQNFVWTLQEIFAFWCSTLGTVIPARAHTYFLTCEIAHTAIWAPSTTIQGQILQWWHFDVDRTMATCSSRESAKIIDSHTLAFLVIFSPCMVLLFLISLGRTHYYSISRERVS